MFKRTRITFQIILTLCSFFGFNEAILAARYRNIAHTTDLNDQLVESFSFTGSSLLTDLEHFWLGEHI